MNQITLKGKNYPCRLTMGAMMRFKKLTGKEVSQIEGDDVSSMTTFFYSCVASASKADEVDFPYDLETFADLIQPADFEGFNKALLATNDEASSSEKKMKPL